MTNPPSTAPDGATADSGVKLSVSEVLSRAADLIEPEGAWMQGWFAKGKSGRDVKIVKYAVCFCAVGAIRAAAGARGFLGSYGGVSGEAEVVVRDYLGVVSLDFWNDRPARTQAQVVAALRGAAEQAREAGQ